MRGKAIVTAMVLVAALALVGGRTHLGAQGRQEGIKIHGHWAIDVRNPDGTLVTHREFENGLKGGEFILASLLTRASTPGKWSVAVNGPLPDDGPCTASPCMIGEGDKTLTVESTGNGVKLHGLITATAARPIGSVATFLDTCAGSESPQACLLETTPFQGRVFTCADFTSDAGVDVLCPHTTAIAPIPVVVGQIIQVTVNISFS